tara:strand:- start:72 stop:1214 length:1143 start_codon:yes stop_codon:yes gene_type:complete
MVSIDKQNTFEIRGYVLDKVKESSEGDLFKESFLRYLELISNSDPLENISQVYLRCAVSGIGAIDKQADDLSRLLGQSSFVDGTPMPWVSNIWAVLGIKWAVENEDDSDTLQRFADWVNEFLPQRIKDGRLSLQEQAIAEYILENQLSIYSASCIALFLHYKNILPLDDDRKTKCIDDFLLDFQNIYQLNHDTLTLALFIYVFDQINAERAAVPSNSWSKDDLIMYLENIPIGLKRWTWEDKPKTKNSTAVSWQIENEYHVQNLLYVLLAPIFTDIADEVNQSPVGHKNPRIDLHLPSINTVIEVKYRKDNKKSFAALIGEIAEDASLYRADPKFRNCTLITFLWDHTRATQEHSKFKEGILKLDGIDACVVVCSPSLMQ